MEEYTLGEIKPRKKFPWAAVSIAAATVIILAGAAVYWSGHREKRQELPSGQVLTTPLPGRVVSDFPKDLLLEPSAELVQSYELTGSGASQPVVIYNSAKSLADNIAAYKNYLSSNGWRIAADGSVSNPAFLYAAKDGFQEQVNATFAMAGDKVQVTLAFLKQ